MSKLIEYMPPFLKNVREFNKIFDAEDIELEELDYNLKKMLTEVIVKMADSYGLDRYENIYNINNTSNNIEIRRINILNKINDILPFTLKWLHNKLEEALGEGNFHIDIDYNNYSIKITILGLSMEIADIYRENLRQQLPANMVIVFDLQINNNIVIGSTIVQKEYNTMKVNQDILKEYETINEKDYIRAISIQKDFITLISNTDILEENMQINEVNYMKSIIIQKEYINLIANTDIKEEEITINSLEVEGINIVQKEQIKLYQNNSIIEQNQNVNSHLENGGQISQKEYIKMKEE